MNKDLGVWTAQDCALVLIDYQEEMSGVIGSQTNADMVELNVRLLAKTAGASGMPTVPSTVGVGYFAEAPKLTDQVGVAEAGEKAAAIHSSGGR